jgi:transposase-like protein
VLNQRGVRGGVIRVGGHLSKQVGVSHGVGAEAADETEFQDEFKAGAVRLVLDEGKSVTGAAKNLGLATSVLGRWVEQARADNGRSTRGTLSSDEKEDLGRLRKDVARFASSERH